MGGLAGWMLGFALGVRHSLEPDHLTAVSTLVVDGRGARRSAAVGAVWGLGHTLALLLLGGALALLESRMPAWAARDFELAVAAMLIVLGLNAIRRAAREPAAGPFGVHAHGAHEHGHAHSGPHVHVGGWTLAWRPLLVGLVHGTAGSGALTALVLAGLGTNLERLVYISLFGLGSTLGMALLSGLAGLSLSRLALRPGLQRGFTFAVGLLSAAVGVAWGWPLLGHPG